MKRKVDIDKAFEEGTLIDKAMNEAAQAALRLHRQSGHPLVVWRNNRVTYVDPFTDQIVPPPKSKKRLSRKH